MNILRAPYALMLGAAIGLPSAARAQPTDANMSRLAGAFELINNEYVRPVDMTTLSNAAAETIRQKSAIDDAAWAQCISKVEAVMSPRGTQRGRLETIANALVCASPNRSPEQLDEVVDAAIITMLSKLDEFSILVRPDDFRRFFSKGYPASVGLMFQKNPAGIIVVHLTPNGPAALAGISQGDVIVSIDDEPTTNLSSSYISQKLLGPENSLVTISVKGDNKLTKNVSVNRQKINHIDDVLDITQRGSVIIIDLHGMPAGVAAAIKTRLVENKSPTSLVILDLRNNSGGLLDQAVALADLLLDKATVVTSRGRTSRDIIAYSSKDGQIAPQAHIAILINKYTAAGAEIVAAAIQDNKRGVVFGEKSQGAGTVQTFVPLGKEYALRLTTSYEYRPDGKRLVDEPIEPDCPSADVPGLVDYAIEVASKGVGACRRPPGASKGLLGTQR